MIKTKKFRLEIVIYLVSNKGNVKKDKQILGYTVHYHCSVYCRAGIFDVCVLSF